MICRFEAGRLPQVAKCYTVIRRTVWQVADPFHILLYVQQGQCVLEANGQAYTLAEGDLFFLPEKTMYVRRPVENELCTLFYAHFRMPGMETMTEEEARKEALSWKQSMDAALLRDEFLGLQAGQMYLSPLIHLQKRREEAGRIIGRCARPEGPLELQHAMMASAMVYELLLLASGEVLEALLGNSALLPAERTPEKLRQAIFYIRQHESEKISLADLCAACAVSKQQMIRYFRACLHTTPTEYIIRYKMNKAMELFMRAPGLSVKEIAGELGFEDQCYFSRVFTRVTGETPTAFRSRVLAFDERRHIAEAQKNAPNAPEGASRLSKKLVKNPGDA